MLQELDQVHCSLCRHVRWPPRFNMRAAASQVLLLGWSCAGVPFFLLSQYRKATVVFPCSGSPFGRTKRDGTVIEFETFLPIIWTSRALVSLVLCPSCRGGFCILKQSMIGWISFTCCQGFFSFWTIVQQLVCVDNFGTVLDEWYRYTRTLVSKFQRQLLLRSKYLYD